MNSNKNILISVIVPVYNVEAYLKDCLESLVRQTYKNIEIILVDDGSTDSSGSTCDSYETRFENIKVIHKENGGLVNARKAGTAAANGDYITCVDGDDWIDIDAYERLAACLDKNCPDVLIFGIVEEYEDKEVELLNALPCGFYGSSDLRDKLYPVMLSYGAFYQSGILPNMVVKLVKKELIKKSQQLVFDEVTIGEDAVCTALTMLEADSAMISDIAPYHYRKRTDSMMGQRIKACRIQSLFDNLYQAFTGHAMAQVLLPQLKEYMMFALLSKQYEIFFESGLEDIPFGRLGDCKVALYGAGKLGQEIYLKTREAFPGRITLWTDKNYRMYQQNGIPVRPIWDLLKTEYDLVVIAVINNGTSENIKDELAGMGVPPQKIRGINISNSDLEKVYGRMKRKYGQDEEHYGQ